MGGGGTKTKEQATTTTKTDPYLQGLLTQNYNSAQEVANRPYEAYGGQLVAGLTPQQMQAYEAVGNLGNVGTSQLGTATNYATQAGQYNPIMLGTNYQAQNVTPGQIASTDLSPYYNPYTDQVVQTTMNQLDEQRKRALVGNAQGMTTAGSNPFGGDRIGVQNALTNEYFGNQAASTLANLYSDRFNTATNLAGQDIGTNLQGQLANQGAGLQAQGLNLSAGQSNQAAKQAQAQIQLGASSALSGLSQQELNMALQKVGALESAGAAQQSQEQAQLDAAYQQWLSAWNYPLIQQQIRNESLGLFPVTGTTSSSGTSSTKQSLGLGGVLGGVGSLLGGIGSLGSGGVI